MEKEIDIGNTVKVFGTGTMFDGRVGEVLNVYSTNSSLVAFDDRRFSSHLEIDNHNLVVISPFQHHKDEIENILTRIVKLNE